MTRAEKAQRSRRTPRPAGRKPGAFPAPPPRASDVPGTRQTLMHILKRQGESDVAALAGELGISGVAVRQHLSALERDGQVTQRSVRRPVGRPARRYRLTEGAEAAFPQSSDRVALDLLARMEKLMGREALEKLFRARLRDLTKRYHARLDGAKSWKKKLDILARIRDEEGYFCAVEAAPAREAREGRRLVEHHCPVAAIARQHPQVCRYELELFRRLLGDPKLERVSHILSGSRACAYQSPAKTAPG